MKVTICEHKEAPIRVQLKVGDIQFSLEKAMQLRDMLTSIIEKYKRMEKEKTNGR